MELESCSMKAAQWRKSRVPTSKRTSGQRLQRHCPRHVAHAKGSTVAGTASATPHVEGLTRTADNASPLAFQKELLNAVIQIQELFKWNNGHIQS